MTGRSWAQCHISARALLEQHEFNDWRIVVEDFRCATDAWKDWNGKCDLDARTIYLDVHLPYGQFRTVILHEIAHALRGVTEVDHGHDLRWARIALELGCTRGHVQRTLADYGMTLPRRTA